MKHRYPYSSWKTKTNIKEKQGISRIRKRWPQHRYQRNQNIGNVLSCLVLKCGIFTSQAPSLCNIIRCLIPWQCTGVPLYSLAPIYNAKVWLGPITSHYRWPNKEYNVFAYQLLKLQIFHWFNIIFRDIFWMLYAICIYLPFLEMKRDTFTCQF